MNEELNRLNDRAELVDGAARRDFARRVRAAKELKGRCAPYTAVRDLDELPAPLPVVGLSVLARGILALVAHFVARGSAGVEVGLWELSYRYRKSLISVRRARDELVRKGWLVKTPQYVPAAETKLLGPYVSASGKWRSLRAEDPQDPDAYDQSQARNLYTLGSLAVAAGFGERCGQVGAEAPDTPDEQATLSASSSGSGSDSGSASPESPDRPCGFVDNSTVEPEIEGSASSPRSTLPLDERDGDSLLAAAHFVDASTPLVADALGDVDQVGDGDGSEAVMEGAPRRGLFAKMGLGLARFLGGAS
jgi:hypothetical protein